MRIVEFVVRPIIAALLIVFLVKGNNINDGLRMLLLVLLSNSVRLESTLPLLGKPLTATVSMEVHTRYGKASTHWITEGQNATNHRTIKTMHRALGY